MLACSIYFKYLQVINGETLKTQKRAQNNIFKALTKANMI